MATRKKKTPATPEPSPGVLVQIAAFTSLIVLQSRAEMSDEAIEEYHGLYADGRKLPPITVYHEGGTTEDPESWTRAWVPDGAHRLEAAIAAELQTIEALARPGTEDDAWRAAFGANVGHGLRRTNADKRSAVRMAMKRWPKLSARKIAEVCAVTHPFVLTLKAEEKLARDGGAEGESEEETEIDTDAYYAPRDLAEAVDAAIGGVELDPCSHPDAPMWSIAKHSISAKHGHSVGPLMGDGLSHDWKGRTWLQPPYSDPAPWAAKLLEHHEAGDVPRALVMVMASTIGTPWCASLMGKASSLGAVRRRVEHIPGGGQKASRPREGSIIIGLGSGIDWSKLTDHADPFLSPKAPPRPKPRAA